MSRHPLARLVAALLTASALAACAARAGGVRPPPPERGEHRRLAPLAEHDRAEALRRQAAIAALPGDAWERHRFAHDSLVLPFRLLPPLGAREGERLPLVVVLHGSGEMGSDGERHLDRFPKAWARREIRERFRAWVVAPQVPVRSADYSAPPDRAERHSLPGPALPALVALVDSLRRALPVDTARVYVVGFSMGGSTTWNLVAERPDWFAAAIPVAGVPPAPSHLAALARVPLWIIHGDADRANPITPDRAVHDSLRARGAPVAFWEFLQGVHEVPPELLAGDHFQRWLFRHRR